MLGRPARRQPGAHRPDGRRRASGGSGSCSCGSASRRSRSASRPPRSPTSTSPRAPDRGRPRPGRRLDPGAHAGREELIEQHDRERSRREAGDRPPLQLDVGAPAARRLPRGARGHRRARRRTARKLCARALDELPETEIRFEYSPESFTGTELDFALEICEAVLDVWQPRPEWKMIVNLPATVEMSTPNVYADQFEWFGRTVSRRDCDHPVDSPAQRPRAARSRPPSSRSWPAASASRGRCSATASARATSISSRSRSTCSAWESTPSSTSRTSTRRGAWSSTATSSRSTTAIPYVGELVYTAFSGSHQDAIKKGMEALEQHAGRPLGSPLPPDRPEGRRPYLRGDHPRQQPVREGRRRLRHEGRARARPAAPAPDRVLEGDPAVAETHGGEVTPEQIWDCFAGRVPPPGPARDRRPPVERRGATSTRRSRRSCGSTARSAPPSGRGNGPIASFVDALAGLGHRAARARLPRGLDRRGRRRARRVLHRGGRRRPRALGRRHPLEHRHRVAPGGDERRQPRRRRSASSSRPRRPRSHSATRSPVTAAFGRSWAGRGRPSRPLSRLARYPRK